MKKMTALAMAAMMTVVFAGTSSADVSVDTIATSSQTTFGCCDRRGNGNNPD